MDTTIEGRPKTAWLRQLYRRLEKLTTHTVAVSETTRAPPGRVGRRRPAAADGASTRRSSSAAWTIRPARARSARRARHPGRRGRASVPSGRLDPVKRPVQLLAALTGRLRAGAHLVLVGDGALRPVGDAPLPTRCRRLRASHRSASGRPPLLEAVRRVRQPVARRDVRHGGGRGARRRAARDLRRMPCAGRITCRRAAPCNSRATPTTRPRAVISHRLGQVLPVRGQPRRAAGARAAVRRRRHRGGPRRLYVGLSAGLTHWLTRSPDLPALRRTVASRAGAIRSTTCSPAVPLADGLRARRPYAAARSAGAGLEQRLCELLGSPGVTVMPRCRRCPPRPGGGTSTSTRTCCEAAQDSTQGSPCPIASSTTSGDGSNRDGRQNTVASWYSRVIRSRSRTTPDHFDAGRHRARQLAPDDLQPGVRQLAADLLERVEQHVAALALKSLPTNRIVGASTSRLRSAVSTWRSSKFMPAPTTVIRCSSML